MGAILKYDAMPLPGTFLVEAESFEDRRGSFTRFFCQDSLSPILGTRHILQINQSVTHQPGALRGMHFQRPPHAECKLVRCLRGRVFDVIVDLRANSPTFLQWHGEELSGNNQRMMFVPEGFAHGFQALESDCEMLYFHTTLYHPASEGGVRHDDPMIGIEWPLEVSDISSKDRDHPQLKPGFEGIL